MSEPGSRWQKSDVTFGLAGRLFCTLGLIGFPTLLLLYGGLFGAVGTVVWCGWLLPRALRDTWRRAELPPTDLTRLRDETARRDAEERRPRPNHPAFDPNFKPPTRW